MLEEGRIAEYYGVDNHMFKLDNDVYEAVEDKEDGYRSMLSEIAEVTSPQGYSDLIFFKTPLATVEVVFEESSSVTLYHLKDVNSGHIWLTFGTNEMSDYYPYFVFNHYPVPSKALLEHFN